MMKSQSSFSFYFSYGKCLTIKNVLSHLYFIFWKLTSSFENSLLNWIVCFLYVQFFLNFLYILDTNICSKCSWESFFLSLGCLFTKLWCPLLNKRFSVSYYLIGQLLVLTPVLFGSCLEIFFVPTMSSVFPYFFYQTQDIMSYHGMVLDLFGVEFCASREIRI